MFARCTLIVTAMIFLSAQMLFAQGESAVPFLLIGASPQANGMGEINASRITDDPLAMLANPAQVGMQGFGRYLASGFYLGATPWLPAFQQPDLTFSAFASSAAVDLRDVWPDAIPLSLGIGYSQTNINLGEFNVTGPGGPDIIGTFQAEEHTNNMTLSAAVEYGAKLSIGYTYKQVTSNLAPFNVQGTGREGVGRATTFDAGLLFKAPLVDLATKLTGTDFAIAPKLLPLVDLSMGYVRSNLGNETIVYIDPSQADPLPRTATLGASVKLGLVTQQPGGPWEVVTATIAREASDLLVVRTPEVLDSVGNEISPSSWHYTSGAGAISFFQNIILGEWGGHVELHKGWELNIGEFFYYRAGSLYGRGRSFSTNGLSIRFGGMMKFLAWFQPNAREGDVFRFLQDHVDLEYNHSSYSTDDRTSPLAGTTFNGMQVIIR